MFQPAQEWAAAPGKISLIFCSSVRRQHFEYWQKVNHIYDKTPASLLFLASMKV
jgi:hypothetical protein